MPDLAYSATEKMEVTRSIRTHIPPPLFPRSSVSTENVAVDWSALLNELPAYIYIYIYAR